MADAPGPRIVMGPHRRNKRALAVGMRRHMTQAEALLWVRLRNNRCLRLSFRRQQVIDGFISNFYCEAAALVVEVDGGVHGEQAEYDALRSELLEARGLLVVRCCNEQVLADPDAVAAAIARICSSRLETRR